MKSVFWLSKTEWASLVSLCDHIITLFNLSVEQVSCEIRSGGVQILVLPLVTSVTLDQLNLSVLHRMEIRTEMS